MRNIIISVIFIFISTIFCGPARVFVLSGQSNMEGFGNVNDLPNTSTYTFDNVRIYTAMHGKEFQNIDQVLTPGISSYPGCFGPEIGIAEILSKYTNDKIIFVKLPWGGSGLTHWVHDTEWIKPAGSNYVSGFVYEWFKDKLKTVLVDNIHEDYTIEGMFWMQGETDAWELSRANQYKENLSIFINERIHNKLMEWELSHCINADTLFKLPFIFGKISDHRKDNGEYYWPFVEILHVQQEEANNEIPYTSLSNGPAEELATLGGATGSDFAHYDANGILHVGRSLGICMVNYLIDEGREGWFYKGMVSTIITPLLLN